MIGLEREIPARLLVPVCPGCGDERVRKDDGSPRDRCRKCRLDLYTHRPRSYAEMEGLIDEPGELAALASAPRGLLARVCRGLNRVRVKMGIR